MVEIIHHEVVKGETASRIAAQYDTLGGWPALVRANPSIFKDGDPRLMAVGQVLHIPSAVNPPPPPPPPEPPPPSPDLDPSGSLYINSSDQIFENLLIEGVQDGVRIEGADNITLRNITFRDIGYKSIYALDSSNIYIENCTFENGGRNYVQFDKIQGGHVIGCVGANQLGDSIAEDFVSIYKSHGTAAKPILVADNNFSDGGPSNSGSGIMLGDANGSYQTARNNTLTNPGQVGIGVAGGNYIVVDDNTVTSISHPWSNVGIYVWNQNSSPCGSITVTNNKVNWINDDGRANPRWFASNCGTITQSGNDWDWSP